jgi:hypothetical protein
MRLHFGPKISSQVGGIIIIHGRFNTQTGAKKFTNRLWDKHSINHLTVGFIYANIMLTNCKITPIHCAYFNGGDLEAMI